MSCTPQAIKNHSLEKMMINDHLTTGAPAAPRFAQNDQSLEAVLHRCALPKPLIDRLRQDSTSCEEYQRVMSADTVHTLPENSSYCGSSLACFCCMATTLVPAGFFGTLRRNEEYHFLAPGYHTYCSCGNSIGENYAMSQTDRPVINGPNGFITLTEGNIGVMKVGPMYRLLAPGTYQWSSPRVVYEDTVNFRENIARLGPYTLVTVPDGEAAVTHFNGELRILGGEARDGSVGNIRTYFLDDPKWIFATFLSLRVQTDRLEGNDLLSKDNVELVMVAMSQWRIVDPMMAVVGCAKDMKQISERVNKLIRAAIARIVAGTNIGAGPVGGSINQVVPAVRAQAAPKAPAGFDDDTADAAAAAPQDDADLAHLMQSAVAIKHMAELSIHMSAMGVEVQGVYVPEKRMKNDDIRKEVARQAVIGIKADAERASADAKAYAERVGADAKSYSERTAADAKAYGTVQNAKADAEAVGMLATAHTDAGKQLGDPTGTAARLALSETTGKALKDAKMTIFSGAPDRMPFMFGTDPMK